MRNGWGRTGFRAAIFTFAFLVALSVVANVSRAADSVVPTKPDLIGVVKGAGGQTVANASIFINTAGPRQGVGFL